MKPCSSVPLHAHVRHVLSRVLFRYGRAVARCPWPFLVLPVLVLGELGAGLLLSDAYDVWDDVNLPRDSQSFKDQGRVASLFPDHTGDHYDALELNEDQIMGSVIFTATRPNASIYDDDVIQEIRHVITDVKTHVTIQEDGVTLKYEDLCGRRHNVCVVTGERLLAPQFNQMRQMGILSYPKWKLPTTGDSVDLSFALADADSQLKKVGVVRVTFKLRHDLQPKVFLWEEAFVEYMKNLKTNLTDVVFSASSSISHELKVSFNADVLYVWLCLALLAGCGVAVTWGGDVVSTRLLLVPMGVVSPVLGILAAMGLLSYCKVKVVEMTWVVPLLVLGKGLSDMFLLMTAWSSRLGRKEEEGDVEQRVGWCVAEVGGTITLTSLTLTLAFCLGYTCTTPSLANFCLYAGVAVMFCYISTMMFGVGCLATHGHRVTSSRHTVTCRVTRSRDQLKKEGRSLCWDIVCGGTPAAENYGDQSIMEKVSRWVLLKSTGSLVGKVVISVLFLSLLAASIFGIINMKQGVELKTLMARSSFIHNYLQTDSRHFGFSFPVVFVMAADMRYNQATAALMMDLLDKAQQDPGIQDDFLRCWIADFVKSPSYNLTTKGEDFPGKLVEEFLLKSETFIGDVVLDKAGKRVAASRCYVFTNKNSDQEDMTRLMQRTRTLAAEAGFPVFAYHPVFLNYDQRLTILPTLFQMMGTALAVLCILHLILFPEMVSLLLTVTGTASVLLGTVGLMNFLGISVSFVSIPHVILNVGFALQFSAQVSTAYLQSEFSHRGDRVADAVGRAAVPVFLSAVCLLGSALVLLAASSYSFEVLLRVTVLTLLMIVFHCVFFTPVILSVVGPEKSQEEIDKDRATKEDIIRWLKKPATTRETWTSDPVQSDMKVHTVGNGSIGPRYVNGKRLLSTIPKADYENASVGRCHHGLTSSSFEQAGRSRSPSGYYNTATGQYENCSRRNGGDSGRDVYDLPVSLPSTRSEGAGDRVLTDAEFGDRSSRPLPRRTGVPSPLSSPKSAGRQGKVPHSPRAHRGRANTPGADLGTTVDDVDDTFLESPQPVTSLEGVHHVACTLSTSGALAGTQNYVTENFHDIPL